MQFFLFFILFVILIIDYKKAIIIYAPLKLFFLGGIKLFLNLPFDAIFSTIAVLMFFAKNKNLHYKEYPIGSILPLLLCTSLLGAIFPSFHISNFLNDFFGVYLYALVFYISIKEERYFRVALRWCALFSIVICINGIIEYLTDVNYLRTIQQSMATDGTYFSENALERFGITHRVCSCIPHSIGFGVVCASFMHLFLFHIFSKNKDNNKIPISIAIFFVFIGVILSGSRSPLLGLSCMLAPYFISKSIITMKNIVIAMTFIVVVYYYAGDYISNMFLSLIDTDIAEEASGSDLDMRLIQFELALNIWLDNFLFGIGQGVSLETIDASGLIRGAESVWLQTLIRKGTIGMIALFILYASLIKHIIKTDNNKKFALSFIIGWLVIYSVTSLPGISDFFGMMIIFLIMRFDNTKFDLKANDTIYNNTRI